MYLVFRYNYSVQEVWGPYATEGEAENKVTEIVDKPFQSEAYQRKYFAVVPVTHVEPGWTKA